jgi:hypothetical protein
MRGPEPRTGDHTSRSAIFMTRMAWRPLRGDDASQGKLE